MQRTAWPWLGRRPAPKWCRPWATWSQIEADFSAAANNLPTSRGGAYSEPGRPLASAARAYLGRAQLYQGKCADALSSLESVINSGDFALNADFSANFRSSGENSSEAIFSIQFASDGGQSPQGNRGGTLNMPIGSMTGGMCCGFYQPTQDLAYAFPESSSLVESKTSNLVKIRIVRDSSGSYSFAKAIASEFSSLSLSID